MKLISPWLIVAMIGGVVMAADGKQRKFSFKKEDSGKVAADWTAAQTGKGEGSVWKVVADDSGPAKTGFVLAQTAKSPNAVFNLCVADDTKYKDLKIQVAFKAVAGELDQGGGLVWRYKDNNNYYIARMNPLEDNFRVYKVVDGKRSQLATKEELKVPAGEWHRIRIEQTGDHIECSLDGKKYLDAHDATFPDAGKIGLWSKADAQSHFDDLQVEFNE